MLYQERDSVSRVLHQPPPHLNPSCNTRPSSKAPDCRHSRDEEISSGVMIDIPMSLLISLIVGNARLSTFNLSIDARSWDCESHFRLRTDQTVLLGNSKSNGAPRKFELNSFGSNP